MGIKSIVNGVQFMRKDSSKDRIISCENGDNKLF